MVGLRWLASTRLTENYPPKNPSKTTPKSGTSLRRQILWRKPGHFGCAAGGGKDRRRRVPIPGLAATAAHTSYHKCPILADVFRLASRHLQIIPRVLFPITSPSPRSIATDCEVTCWTSDTYGPPRLDHCEIRPQPPLPPPDPHLYSRVTA